MQVGETSLGGRSIINPDMRAAIDAPIEVDVRPSDRHEILISEMDRVNQTCKLSGADKEGERRISGYITILLSKHRMIPIAPCFLQRDGLRSSGSFNLWGEPDVIYFRYSEPMRAPLLIFPLRSQLGRGFDFPSLSCQ